MISIGERIFYERATGIVLVTTPSYFGDVAPMTIDEYIQIYPVLRERDRNSFDVLEVEYGQYEEDFMTARSWRVNLETKSLEFSYPDPNDPEAPPVFQQPLTEQVKALEAENAELKKLIEQTDRENKNAIFEIYTMIGG
ncbi:uncharacterized protein YceH (UPF0502 family) [Paenibacillus sp. LBL]|uniref:hypothetical protein n=1 Tax=Paenibacillus sp. LBL TaxID=2940563 RepID=UPI0024742656|nr:hypothetical protein [Paenibacillus sp. LBL]MDH6674670.1 uncharacterized protein YceH (UPF0502 family) [Paenibacillus sp. LBL]